MAINSNIEWTDHTGNIWWGCEEVRPECDNCYARVLSNRWGNDVWGPDKPRLKVDGIWKSFRRFQKLAMEGKNTKTKFGDNLQSVFVGSMMDIFEKPKLIIDKQGDSIPIDMYEDILNTEHLRNQYFTKVIPETPNLIHLLLTKRPSNIPKYIPKEWFTNPPKNVMLGTSVGSESSLRMIEQLLSTGPQFRYFLSCEPMIEGFSLSKYIFTRYSGEGVIDWVIVGGESGPHKRPFNPDWARELRDECNAAGAAFFMKQMDKVQAIPGDLFIRQFPKFSL